MTRWMIRALTLALLPGVMACGGPSPSKEPVAAPAGAAAVPASQPGMTTVTGRAPRGTVVALEPGPGVERPSPQGTAMMDQRGQQFLPDMLVARVGQPVEFRNGEGIPHNVYVTRAVGGTVELNVSTDPFQAHTHTFTRTGAYNVSCDIHPSMRGQVIVVDTPYVATAGDFGSYQIMNVPPGPYTLVAMFGDRTTDRAVEVSGAHLAVDVADR